MTKETTEKLLTTMKTLYSISEVVKDAADIEPYETGQEFYLRRTSEEIKDAADDLKKIVLNHGKFTEED